MGSLFQISFPRNELFCQKKDENKYLQDTRCVNSTKQIVINSNFYQVFLHYVYTLLYTIIKEKLVKKIDECYEVIWLFCSRRYFLTYLCFFLLTSKHDQILQLNSYIAITYPFRISSSNRWQMHSTNASSAAH